MLIKTSWISVLHPGPHFFRYLEAVNVPYSITWPWRFVIRKNILKGLQKLHLGIKRIESPGPGPTPVSRISFNMPHYVWSRWELACSAAILCISKITVGAFLKNISYNISQTALELRLVHDRTLRQDIYSSIHFLIIHYYFNHKGIVTKSL